MLSEGFLMHKEKFYNEMEASLIKAIFFRFPAMLIALFILFYPIKSVFALELSADEQAYLHSRGTIVFVSQTRYPPFEFVDKGIKLAQQSGVLEKISRKWIGTHYTPRESLLFKYLIQIYISAGAILVLALLIWFWNVRLRQLVKERTEKLEKSEEKYRELAEFLPQPVFELDTRGDFIYSNRCGLETFGYTLDDFEKGVNALQLFIPEDRQRIQENIQKRLAGEDFENHEYTGLRKDGSTFPILIYSAPIARNGKTVGVRGIVLDITDRKRTEEQIIQAKQEWEQTFNTIPDLIAILDDNHRMVRVNKAMADKLGVSPDAAIGMSCYEHVHGAQEPPPFCPHSKLLSDEQEHLEEVHEYRLGGIFQVSVTPFRNSEGNLVGSVHVARDITERKRVEKALLDSEEKYKLLAEHSADVIYKLNIENEQYTYVSPSVERVLGYTAKESLSLKVQDVLTTESYDRQRENLAKALASGRRDPEILELEAVHKDGHTVPVEIHASLVLDEQGNPLEIVGVARDITERKRVEKQIKTSLKEKEILLREIHHRVKNNLAVISSLLSMQANIVPDRVAHLALQESQSRVNAMALIHEALYQSEGLALVNLERYAKDLIGNIVAAFDGITGRIHFEIEVQDVELEINQAIPCGLIINELATNALKHAFADGQNGMVRITAGYTNQSEVELTVSDNGTGFSEELDWKKSKSLGLRLISLMVDQLHGNMNIRNNHGAEIAIKWPVQVA
jgi:two-component system, sensor histidine kinase PdtaS